VIFTGLRDISGARERARDMALYFPPKIRKDHSQLPRDNHGNHGGCHLGDDDRLMSTAATAL